MNKDVVNPQLLVEAHTRSEAQLIHGLLRAAGLPAYLDGETLVDEMASSQQLMNIQGAKIFVPSDRIEEARRMVEEWRSSDDLVTRFDIDFVRSFFPALDTPWAFFDNAGGSVPTKCVIDRISQFMSSCPVQLGATYEHSERASRIVAEGRAAMASWIGASEQEVVLGPSTTANAKRLAQSLRHLWSEGDEIVVTDLDHESNVGPWLALSDTGMNVKTWPFSMESHSLHWEDLEPLLTERTRAVCFSHCSNIVGAIHDVKTIATRLRERGILSIVDGVAYAPHRRVNVKSLGVDAYMLSAYKTLGPHQGILYIDKELMTRAKGQNHFFYSEDDLPFKLEPGGVNYELVASLPGILEYLDALALNQGASIQDPLSKRLDHAHASIAQYEAGLANLLVDFLTQKSNVQVLGPQDGSSDSRVSTIAFIVDGKASSAIPPLLDQSQLAARYGHFYAYRAIEKLGLLERDGVVRVSMLHYNGHDEVRKLIEALDEIL